MNIEKDILRRVNLLPEELSREIYSFIPGLSKIFFNKPLYLRFHKYLKPFLLQKNLYDSYIRFIIRKDLVFVFIEIFLENCEYWIKCKKYTYKNKTFSNYMYLLEQLCIETESTKCRNKIRFFLEQSGLLKNQHKNKTSKVIKRQWTN